MKKHISALALIGVLALTGCASPETTTETCTVNDKTATSNKSQVKYLIYTDECGVLIVEDAALKGQWNSSDTYSQINIGKTYEFELYGFRNGFLSSYPNILTLTEVPA